jgi:hypothetical protein
MMKYFNSILFHKFGPANNQHADQSIPFQAKPKEVLEHFFGKK